MRTNNSLLISGGIMTALSAYLIYDDSLLIGYSGLLFFGGGTVLLVVQAIRGKQIAVPAQPTRSADWLNEHGIFEYTEDGFTVKLQDSTHGLAWTEVNSMFAYKIDLYTIDTICLEVFSTGDFGFKITEETPGWFQFTQRSKQALPSIDKSWDIQIAVPAFATKFTLIYDKMNRSSEEAAKHYYKD